ncbi:hypothetical protein [Mycolicibacterium iranicum]|nr:hypothetical protein [Mycolicibacterium iranicum]
MTSPLKIVVNLAVCSGPRRYPSGSSWRLGRRRSVPFIVRADG